MMASLMSVMVGHMLTELIMKRSPVMKEFDFDWFGTTIDIFLHAGITIQGFLISAFRRNMAGCTTVHNDWLNVSLISNTGIAGLAGFFCGVAIG